MEEPNVVIVLMDTAKFPAVSAVRETRETVLQSLAEEGTEYTSAFANAPWSLPSHASLFTGCYTSKHGAHAGYMNLDDDLVILSEVFKEEGYETVAVSNNTWISEEFGFGRGFDRFEKTWQYLQSDVDLGRIARTEDGFDKITAVGRELFSGNPLVNLTNAIYGRFFRRQHDDGARRTNEWIDSWLGDRSDSKPFFLFVNYLEPHLEYRPPESFAREFLPPEVSYEAAMKVTQDAFGYIGGAIEMADSDFEILHALYKAEIAYLDERIEELKDHLAVRGEWENTVFVVTGDHGENIGDHGLMDHQYCLYDTLLHVPLIVHGGPFSNGNIVDDLVQLTDLAPTLLDTLDIDAPEAHEQFQGISFHPDADTTREYAIAEYMAPQPSMGALEKRVGDLPDDVLKYDRSLRAVRTDRYKYIRGSDGSQELYDIRNDPDETDNIASIYESVVAELDAELDSWLNTFESANQTGNVSMDEDTKARLEDLGYLQ